MYYHVNQYECRAIFYQIIKLTDGKQKTTKQQQINKLQIKESLEKEKKSKFKLAEYLFNISKFKLTEYLFNISKFKLTEYLFNISKFKLAEYMFNIKTVKLGN